jgi:uncharacterized flavoprotein (TIGR03862 family)
VKQGKRVAVFEKKAGPGRKLLIAGSSGLNITYDAPLEEFANYYGARAEEMRLALDTFSPTDWRTFIEAFGIPTFLGTSRRYFVKGMKASPLLRAWTKSLADSGLIEWHFQKEWKDFESKGKSVELSCSDGSTYEGASLLLALGGGSYEAQLPAWPEILTRKGLKVHPLTAANVGFHMDWPPALFQEAEGKALKNIVLTTRLGQKQGELMITRYGLEGPPVYFVGTEGPATLDLLPDHSASDLARLVKKGRENLSPFRRIQKNLPLGPAALALLFHTASPAARQDLPLLLERIKKFPLTLGERRPLEEAISSSGGLDWNECDEKLMLRSCPGVFCAGEMLDWTAPTGGFLIQGAVSTGFQAAQGILAHLKA